MIFLAVLPALEVSVNLTLQKFHGWKMTEKWRKAAIKSKMTPHTDQYRKFNFPWVRDIHCTFIHMRVNLVGICKGILTMCKWSTHLIVPNLVNSGITVHKMAKVITLILLSKLMVLSLLSLLCSPRCRTVHNPHQERCDCQGNQTVPLICELS